MLLLRKRRNEYLKAGSIIVPTQEVTVLVSKGNRETLSGNILDLKSLAQGIGNNFNINETGEKIPWGNIKVIQVRKSDPPKLYYERTYKQDKFQCINVLKTQRRGRTATAQVTLAKAYSSTPKINVKERSLNNEFHSDDSGA